MTDRVLMGIVAGLGYLTAGMVVFMVVASPTIEAIPLATFGVLSGALAVLATAAVVGK